MKRFWKNTEEAAARLRTGGRLLVALDFDGTLAALAETPGKARLRPEFREALRRLAACPGVHLFVLSGRELGNVSRLVGLKGLYYGGNHGIELKGPGLAWRDAGAAKARARVAALAADTRERFPAGTGVLVEDKGFSASIHYRNLKPAYRAGFFARMRALTAAGHKDLSWSRGHKVFELRPAGAPHKGDALLRLLRRLQARTAVAVGDDLTDEDMFRTLPGGITIRIGRKAGSAAAYYIARQSEVLRLLRFIAAERKRGEG